VVDGQLIDEAVDLVRSRWTASPRVGIILGTGLGELVEEIDIEEVLEFSDLPGFTSTTALGHRGRLVCGRLDGQPVVVLDGRLHRYEGHDARQITRPVHLFHRLGAGGLIVSNASGGVNPQLLPGDLLVMDSHVNLMFMRIEHAGVGDGSEWVSPIRQGRLGASPYHQPWVDAAMEVAAAGGFRAMAGTYVAMTGPNYETRAEYRMVRCIGGDVVGMSTVPEVIVASRLGMKVLGLSAVTNVSDPDHLQEASAEKVVEVARSVQPAMRAIVAAIVAGESQLDSSQ
jgi:purine-nucleoside phosphorylase